MSRWILLYATSNSGKSMFVCKMCGRTSVTPDKTCPELPTVGPHMMPMSCALLEDMTIALEGDHPVDSELYVTLNRDKVTGTVQWRQLPAEMQHAVFRLEEKP